MRGDALAADSKRGGVDLVTRTREAKQGKPDLARSIRIASLISGKNHEVQDLSGRGPWFLRRLPAKFSRGRRPRRLAGNACLVQEISCVGRIFGLGSETVKGCNRRLFHLKTPFQAIPKELAKDVQIRFS